MRNEIEQLIESGEYEQAIKFSDTLEEFDKYYYKGVIALPNSETEWGIENLLKALEICNGSKNGPEKKCLAFLHLALLYQTQGNFDKAEEIITKSQENRTKTDLENGLLYLVIGMQLSHGGEYKKASEKYFEAASIFERIQEFTYESFAYFYLSFSESGTKKIEYGEKARTLAKRANNRRRFAYLSCFTGYLYQTQGEYNVARKLNQFCNDESTKLNYKLGIVNSTFCLGRIGFEEGRIKYAIEQFEKMREKNFEFNRAIEEANARILSYRLIGNETRGLEISKSYIIRYKHLILVSPNVGLLYLQAILILIDIGDIQEAKSLKDDLIQVAGKSANPDLISIVNLCKAILLKANKKMKDTIEAKEIFSKIAKNPNLVTIDTLSEATRNLCEILIQEYELYEDKDVLDEAQELIAELDKKCEKQNLIRIRFEIGIFQSKILLLQGEIDKSRSSLEELSKRAIALELKHFENRIKIEKELIDKNFQKWVDLVTNNESLKSIIEESKMKDYFNLAKQYISEVNE